MLPDESLPADTRPSKRKDQNALITRKTEEVETFPEAAAHTEKPPRRRQLAARAYLPQSAALARLNIDASCASPSYQGSGTHPFPSGATATRRTPAWRPTVCRNWHTPPCFDEFLSSAAVPKISGAPAIPRPSTLNQLLSTPPRTASACCSGGYSAHCGTSPPYGGRSGCRALRESRRSPCRSADSSGPRPSRVPR